MARSQDYEELLHNKDNCPILGQIFLLRGREWWHTSLLSFTYFSLYSLYCIFSLRGTCCIGHFWEQGEIDFLKPRNNSSLKVRLENPRYPPLATFKAYFLLSFFHFPLCFHYFSLLYDVLLIQSTSIAACISKVLNHVFNCTIHLTPSHEPH